MTATKVGLSFFILLLVSCAKIQINTPSQRYISPEAQGKLFSGSFRFEQQTGTEGTIDFEGDRTDNELEIRNNVTPLTGAFDLGITDRLDFVIKGNTGAPTVYMLKYQIMGKNAKEAGADNHSLAFGIGYGTEEQNQTESDTSIFNDTNDDIAADIKQDLLDITLIYGYRPQEDTLVYASLNALKQDVAFELESSDNANLDGESFTLGTWAYGAAVGAVRYWEKYYLIVELNAQRTDYTNNDPITFAHLGMSLGFKWD